MLDPDDVYATGGVSDVLTDAPPAPTDDTVPPAAVPAISEAPPASGVPMDSTYPRCIRG